MCNLSAKGAFERARSSPFWWGKSCHARWTLIRTTKLWHERVKRSTKVLQKSFRHYGEWCSIDKFDEKFWLLARHICFYEPVGSKWDVIAEQVALLWRYCAVLKSLLALRKVSNHIPSLDGWLLTTDSYDWENLAPPHHFRRRVHPSQKRPLRVQIRMARRPYIFPFFDSIQV